MWETLTHGLEARPGAWGAPSSRAGCDSREDASRARTRAWWELCFLFVLPASLIPLLGPDKTWFVVGVVSLLGVAWGGSLLRDASFPDRSFWRLPRPGFRWRGLLGRAAVAGAFCFGWALATEVSVFSALLLHHPERWAGAMAVYAVFSVVPQEIVFRAAFFHRLRPLLVGRPVLAVSLNATLFAFAHTIYGNWPAVLLSALAGAVFAATYLRTRSLLAVSLEHFLWGLLVFATGLGSYFGLG
jgi:uncharacterized protein